MRKMFKVLGETPKEESKDFLIIFIRNNKEKVGGGSRAPEREFLFEFNEKRTEKGRSLRINP